MNKYLKKTLVISASVLMFLSVGAGVNNVQARRYHYRTHRRANWRRYRRRVSRRRTRRPARRRRARRAVRRRKATRRYHIQTEFVDAGWTTNYRHYKNEMNYIKRMHREGKIIKNRDGFDSQGLNAQGWNSEGYNPNPEGLSPKQLRRYAANALKIEQQLRAFTLRDMNHDREANGVAPLRDSPLMDQIAAMRAKQIDVPGDFTHYDYNNNKARYEDEDAQALGINPGADGENIAAPSLGDSTMASGTDGDPNEFHNHNGIGMAHEAEDAMVNYDANENWGHRYNILSPGYNYVGVGAYADPQDPAEYNLVEDFTNGASYNNNFGDQYE